MTTIEQATTGARRLQGFIHPKQADLIGTLCRGEEGEFFKAKLAELGERVATMPETYDQDGLGDDAIAFLHYFTASGDWYITERDMETEQHQAFGLADLGYGPELGYVSLVELFSVPGVIVELDLNFTPTKIGDLRHARATNRPGDMAAEYARETGCSYSEALVKCNMD